jgi:hypothetical protein
MNIPTLKLGIYKSFLLLFIFAISHIASAEMITNEVFQLKQELLTDLNKIGEK